MTAVSWDQAYADHAERLFSEELIKVSQEFSTSKFATRIHRENAIVKALCKERLLNAQLKSIFDKLKQEPLGPEFEKVLAENLWDLYEE